MFYLKYKQADLWLWSNCGTLDLDYKTKKEKQLPSLSISSLRGKILSANGSGVKLQSQFLSTPSSEKFRSEEVLDLSSEVSFIWNLSTILASAEPASVCVRK